MVRGWSQITRRTLRPSDLRAFARTHRNRPPRRRVRQPGELDLRNSSRLPHRSARPSAIGAATSSATPGSGIAIGRGVPLSPVFALARNRPTGVPSAQMFHISRIVLAAEHRVQIAGSRPDRTQRRPENRDGPPMRSRHIRGGGGSRRGPCRRAGTLEFACQEAGSGVDACAAPGTFTAPVRSSSSHSRCTSFSALVVRKPDGPKIFDGTSGVSVVAPPPRRTA